MLDGKRMRLELVGSDRNDPVLVQDDAAMLLAAVDLHALIVGKGNQLLMFRGFQDHTRLFPDQLGHTI